MGTVIPEHSQTSLVSPAAASMPPIGETAQGVTSIGQRDWEETSVPASSPSPIRPGASITSIYLPLADSVPDPKNWKELPQSNITFSHSFTADVEHLYQSDFRKQGPLFEPTFSTAVYFLVHAAPSMSDGLEVLVFDKEGDTEPKQVVPMQRLDDGRYFVGLDDEGKTIGEGTRFAYRNQKTGSIIADPYAYQLSSFEWTTIPGRHELPDQSHFKPLHCVVRQDPLAAALSEQEVGSFAPPPVLKDIKTVKFHTDRTLDLTDAQLGPGFEGTQGTLKALQSPFVQQELLKGFNQVEFFPIHSFGTEVPTFYEGGQFNPDARNVWGFMPISHFSIDPSRVHNKENPWAEVIDTIESLHRAGFRVAVDVVPHSFEAADDRPSDSEDFKGPNINFRELDRDGFYANYKDGRLRNYSGCGNAFRFTPVAGRNYARDSLESIVGEGGAYFLRAIESVFRLGAGVRIDQGILMGRDQNGEFSPTAKVFSLLDQLSHDYGTPAVCESCDCGKHGPGKSKDWIRLEPYGPIPTQDFMGGREWPRRAIADKEMGMARDVANVLNGHGLSYARNGAPTSRRVVMLAPHDGLTQYDGMEQLLRESGFRDHYFPQATTDLLTKAEQRLASADQEKLITRRLVSSAILGVEFLTTFSPSTHRLWCYGSQVLADQGGDHDAYNKPEFSNKSFSSPEPWREEYRNHWLEKEALRDELGVFSHARFLSHPQLRYFDETGHSMNRGYDHEVDARWSAGNRPQILSAWYSGKEFNKPDVLVTWCSGSRRFTHEAVHLPDPGASETGERYTWVRRADSSAFVVPEGKEWKTGVYEPLIVDQTTGVFFQTSGVQVFQRVTEREAWPLKTRYWEQKGQA